MRRTFALVLVSLSLASCGGSGGGGNEPTVPASKVARQVLTEDVEQPMQYLADPTDARRAYVLERPGRVRLLVDDQLQPVVVLDLTSVVSTLGECGLLGMAFAPDFETSRAFYLHYNTFEAGLIQTRVSRFRMAGDGRTASPAVEPVFRVAQPYSNHKGGSIHFGGDGLLYLALGDGGSGNDPENRAQDPSSLLGKVLRLDPNGDDLPADADNNYRIPPDNPFVADLPAARTEIWDFGFRNPFRWSVDAKTKGLVFADVGQDGFEEVDFEPAGKGGRNYGWRVREGLHASNNAGPAFGTAFTDPFLEYDHSVGHSITGGYVVRSSVLGLKDRYLFADFVENKMWSVPFATSGGEAVRTSLAASQAIDAESAWAGVVSIDPDANGAPVVTELNAHRVSRLIAAP